MLVTITMCIICTAPSVWLTTGFSNRLGRGKSIQNDLPLRITAELLQDKGSNYHKQTGTETENGNWNWKGETNKQGRRAQNALLSRPYHQWHSNTITKRLRPSPSHHHCIYQIITLLPFRHWRWSPYHIVMYQVAACPGEGAAGANCPAKFWMGGAKLCFCHT